MATESKTYRLQVSTIKQIEEYAQKNKINHTQAVSDMIDAAYKMQIESEDIIVKKVLDAFENKYKNLFTRIRLGVRTADLNSQITLEVLNTILANMNIQQKDVVTTEKFTNPALKDSKELIKIRLENIKQKKDYQK